MGYTSDVRMITTKKGFGKLKRYVDDELVLNNIKTSKKMARNIER